MHSRQSSFVVCRPRFGMWRSPGGLTSHASLPRAPHPLWSSRQWLWTPAAAFESHTSAAVGSDWPHCDRRPTADAATCTLHIKFSANTLRTIASAVLPEPRLTDTGTIKVPPTLMASMAYSTWNSLPSGLNVLTPLSYSLLVKNMPQSWPRSLSCCCSATCQIAVRGNQTQIESWKAAQMPTEPNQFDQLFCRVWQGLPSS